jgi:hypothetical protein
MEVSLNSMRPFLLIVTLLTQALAQQRTPVGSISGRLLTRGGTPAAHIRVGATSIPEPGRTTTVVDFSSLTETDADGRYVLENLPPGSYHVATGLVSAPNFHPGVGTRSEATVIVVAANSVVSGIDFALKGVNVQGRIIPSPTQIEFEIPELSLRADGATVQTAVLGRDQTFTFLNVQPGRYTVMSTGGAETDFLVPDTDVRNVEVVMPSVIQFTGQLKVENGGLPPKVLLSFTGRHRYSSPGSGDKGGFGMLLPEGEYDVSLAAGVAGYFLKSIEVDGAPTVGQKLKLSATATEPRIVFTLGVLAR